MENLQMQPKENLSVASFDPQQTYAKASDLRLSETEMKGLLAPFNDLDYEVRPDGHIYLPQAISLGRLNSVIGVGQWTLLLINTGSQVINPRLTKVFYDGALIVRGCFVSRAAGEASYSPDNANQSYATALEAAKSDCRQRCCKDLGIASDAWNPTFVRNWQKKYAIKVFVKKGDNAKNEVAWRRRDLDPFWNEVGPVPDGSFSVRQTEPESQKSNDLPWLNDGPDLDAVISELLRGATTLPTLKKTKFKISKSTEEKLAQLVKDSWIEKCAECKSMSELTALWNDNEAQISAHAFLKTVFANRREVLQGNKKPVA